MLFVVCCVDHIGNLDDWYEKFKHYKSYPIVGQVSFPPTDLRLTREQLKEFDGITHPPTHLTTPYISILFILVLYCLLS